MNMHIFQYTITQVYDEMQEKHAAEAGVSFESKTAYPGAVTA